jgi:predicted DNA-binding protein
MMNASEKRLCDWQFELSGSFYYHLFEAISRADRVNIECLRNGFPQEVNAYHNYSTVDGYWDKLKDEYLNGNKKIRGDLMSEEDKFRLAEIRKRLNYLDNELEKGTEDMEDYYEAVELHKELKKLAEGTNNAN